MHTFSLIFTELSVCDNVEQSDDCMIDIRDKNNELKHDYEKCTEKKKNTGINFKTALRKLI